MQSGQKTPRNSARRAPHPKTDFVLADVGRSFLPLRQSKRKAPKSEEIRK